MLTLDDAECLGYLLFVQDWACCDEGGGHGDHGDETEEFHCDDGVCFLILIVEAERVVTISREN